MGAWFRRRDVLMPTWRTCLIAALILLALGWWCALNIHGWLSPVRPVEEARYIIVEGWAPDAVGWAAVQWSKEHETTNLFTTGVPLDKGMMVSQTINYADITAQTLRQMGADPLKVLAVPAGPVNTERTRAMARALKTALDARNVPPADRRINLFTLGTHAWRSHMHFQRELGPTWQVGVISVPNPSYPANRWWHYSEGVKMVINELVGIVVQTVGGE